MERFEQQAPTAVMVRMVLEDASSPAFWDQTFEKTAKRQCNQQLLFSSVRDIMGVFALCMRPSVHAGHVARREELRVRPKAIYDKLQGMGGMPNHAW